MLNALKILPDVFKGTTLSIVEDNDLPPNVPARCFPDEYGNFTIEIKETVYKGHLKNRLVRILILFVMKYVIYFFSK